MTNRSGDRDVSLGEIFFLFLKLGLTSFGGPVAHLGYFQNEFVTRRKWLSQHDYGDLVSLCQILPGPASSQVGISLGMMKGGIFGGVASWCGFTLPSAVLLTLFGLGVADFHLDTNSEWLHGLKIVAVAIVAQAIWGMGKAFCADKVKITFAILAAIFALSVAHIFGQIGIIGVGGILGCMFLRESHPMPHTPFKSNLNHRLGIASLSLFFILLLALPVLAEWPNNDSLAMFDKFYRVGSLVFGGGHVVLPLLKAEVVANGWLSSDRFLAGYGMAQAVPGPLFTFAGYIGTLSQTKPTGLLGAAICIVGIFLPSFLLIIGVLPFWEKIRRYRTLQAVIKGINATVVGLLIAALYDPIWVSTIHTTRDFALAIAAFGLLQFWRTPPWIVVILGAIAGYGSW